MVKERIKELILEAGFPKHVVTDGKELKKFAELLVQECCNMVSDEVECVYDFDNQHPVIARMKEHFGVE